MQNKISVIIPVYNVGRYLDKCLASVLAQTYHNLEIIIINDGSADNSADIIEKYRTDARVIYIEQPNAGVSAARNRGIDAAAGDYLGFVDSDDYIEEKMYEKLLDAVLAADADMSVCNYNLIYDSGHIRRDYSDMRTETADIRDDVYGFFVKYCARQKPNNYIWTRLYKTRLVKGSGVRFEQFRIGDDTLFNFKLLPFIQRAVFLNEGLYNYYQREGSNVYTIANKCGLAREYADTFDALAEHYKSRPEFAPFLECLSIHAYTRLKSVFFYSRLAGMHDAKIAEDIRAGFAGRVIADYLTGAV